MWPCRISFCSVSFLQFEALGHRPKSYVTNGIFPLADEFFLSVNWSCAGAGRSIFFSNILSQRRLHVPYDCFNCF